ncbi:MAG: hypothetical protein KBF32_12035 [Chitinophagales bacterium]|nr:hypothetical protein [Chitinophagales bacterium]
MEKMLDILAWAILILTILLLRFFGNSLENIIHEKNFILIYLTIGLSISGVFLLLIYKLRPSYFIGGETRASAVLSYFFGIAALTLFAAAAFTIQTAQQQKSILSAIITDKSINARYNTPYLNILIDSKVERFQPSKREWDKISIADTLQLIVGKGRLNYYYVFSFSEEE